MPDINALTRAAAEKLAELRFPRLSAEADSDELGAARDYLLELGGLADQLVEAVGIEVKTSVAQPFDLSQFREVVSGSAEFCNAIGELERAAETARAQEA